jgi:hypothetical protein
MPDVTLPNGVVIRGVPEGTNKYTIMEKAISGGLATPEDFGQESGDALEGSTKLGRLRLGVGRGLSATARKAADLVGLHDYEEGEGDKELLNTGMGMTGNVVGEIAATLPVGAAAGGVLRGARAATAASRAPSVLNRALGSGVTRAAVEGGTTGALISNPEDRGAGAALGGVLGGGLGFAGKLIGATVRKVTPEITDQAKKLQSMTGTFIPLSQALKPGIAKQFYEAFLANLPGVGGKIRGQYKHALDDLRRYAGEQAHPPRANVSIRDTDNIRDVFGKLEDYWKTAYDDIKGVPIKLFGGGGRNFNVPKAVREAMDQASDGTFVVPQAGQTVTGETILNLKRAAQELLDEIPKGTSLRRGQRKELEGFINHLEDTLKTNLNPSGKGRGQMAQIYNDYVEKTPYYKTYQDILAAGSKAVANSEFSPAQLASAAGRRAGKSGLSGGADDSVQELGRLGSEVLPDFPSRQGLFQTVAALGIGGGAMSGLGAPVAAGTAGLIAGGRGMASPTFQKLLSGQKDVLKRYAEQLRKAGYSGRQLSVILGEEANASR